MFELPKIRGTLGRLLVGDDYPTRIMGVINVSPESFYKGSIAYTTQDITKRVLAMIEEGADLIDIGGMSTAPYLNTLIPVSEEVERITRAIRAVRDITDITLSVDTFRAEVAEAALKLGADVINDVTGLRGDPKLINVLAEYNPSIIICARVAPPIVGKNPMDLTLEALSETLKLIESKGLDLEKVTIDPCIGFHRFSEIPWYVWDLTVLSKLDEMRSLGRPILVGVSRKSFIGVVLNKEKPEDRLFGSLAFTAVAVLKGVHVIRTHDVSPTREVVMALESFKRFNLSLAVEYPICDG